MQNFSAGEWNGVYFKLKGKKGLIVFLKFLDLDGNYVYSVYIQYFNFISIK